jgi:hypothetical protein
MSALVLQTESRLICSYIQSHQNIFEFHYSNNGPSDKGNGSYSFPKSTEHSPFKHFLAFMEAIRFITVLTGAYRNLRHCVTFRIMLIFYC